MSPVERRAVALPSAASIPEAQRTSRVARWLGITMFSFALLSMFVPWQQSISGSGRVIAYIPSERRQPIQAPVSGRVVRWHVIEGSQVQEGDPLVELIDNDPLLMERLAAERAAVALKLDSYSNRARTFEAQIGTAETVQQSDIVTAQAKLRAAGEKLRAAEQKLKAAEAAATTAEINVERVRQLAERGLSAQRDRELAELAAMKATTEREGARADVAAAQGDLDAARGTLDKARAEGANKVQDAEAKLRSGESDAADARASLERLNVKIGRQASQLIRAPRAGMVLSVVAAQNGEQIKQGDTLAYLVPNTRDRAVELWIDGNDAAIISAGRHVRLQFEGWPAVQFTGWPSVAVGSFGGRVAFVDPHDDGNGNFRAVVLPEPAGDPWPEPLFLRQGVLTKGWILLEQVTLGFELWRRFNGFPPMLKSPPGYATPAAGKEAKP